MIPRLKSVGANLFIGAFCILWPVFLATASPLLGIFIGLFLWPLGVLYFARAVTGRIEDDLLPESPPPPKRVPVQATGPVDEGNYLSLLDWVTENHPGWPRSSHRQFARFLADYFGSRRWSGDNTEPMFADGVRAHLAYEQDHPEIRIELKEISTREELGHFGLKDRLDLSPSTPQTHHYRALASGWEVGFVVLDLPPHQAEMVLYELFLIPNKRRQGFGTATLRAVEDFAWSSRRPNVFVLPRRIDSTSMSDSDLVQWYQARGYRQVSVGDPVLQKVID